MKKISQILHIPELPSSVTLYKALDTNVQAEADIQNRSHQGICIFQYDQTYLGPTINAQGWRLFYDHAYIAESVGFAPDAAHYPGGPVPEA